MASSLGSRATLFPRVFPGPFETCALVFLFIRLGFSRMRKRQKEELPYRQKGGLYAGYNVYVVSDTAPSLSASDVVEVTSEVRRKDGSSA